MSTSLRIVVSALIVAGAVALTSLPSTGTPAPESGVMAGPIPDPNQTPAVMEGDTVTVDGRGRVQVQADRLVIHADLSATAEVGADALADFRDARRRADESLASAELSDFHYRNTGPTASYFEGQDPGAMMGGAIFIGGDMQTMEADPNVRIQARYELTIKRLDEVGVADWEDSMTRALDAAIDAGLTPRQAGAANAMRIWGGVSDGLPDTEDLVEFSSANELENEQKAIEQAMAVAKRRASLMAQLAGKNLGPVRSMTLVSLDGLGPWKESSSEYEAHVRVTFALTE